MDHFIKHRLAILFLFLITVVLSHAQEKNIITGHVMDAETGESLAFVNIVINGGWQGGASDIDGKFKFTYYGLVEYLQLSYVGYEDLKYQVSDLPEELNIYLKEIPYELREVVILPGINPAHRIINNVVEHRDLNDPEKLKSFSYTSYEKTIFTLDLDSLRMLDTLTMDTGALEVRRFFDRQDIFIAESVTERKFLFPERSSEKVIATRVSGMKDPLFVFLVSQIQSTSFYKELLNVGGDEYINPISRGSTSKYIFIIEDTAYTELSDTVFIISFQPKPKTNFDGLKGVLSINTHNWAIQNVIAEPARDDGPFSIKIQQQYELIGGEQWFPVQLNTDLNIRALGARVNDETYAFVGIGKSYIRDIELNPELVKRQFNNIEVDVEPNAHDRPEAFWRKYRTDSLSARDLKTYAFMDSIGREANFDRMARTFESIMTGKIPFKFIDFDIDKFIRYNQFEGFYLGLGMHTNDRLSRRFKIGGFFGYGFKDMSTKYGGDISAILNRNSELEMKAGYFYDAIESAGVSFFDDQKSVLKGDGFRDFLIRRMNMTERAFIGIQFRALEHFKWNIMARSDSKTAYPDYLYGQSSDGVALLMNQYRFTELSLGFRFAFREKFLRTKRIKMSLGTKYPIVKFQYTRSFTGILNGEFEYNRYDIKISESFFTKYLGTTNIELRAGYIDGDLPYCNLYNGNGSYRVFTIYAPSSFATMRMNEFLSNRYVALYLSHNFGELLVRKKFFSPEVVIVTNIAFGDLNNPEQHHNIAYNTMEKGYYESGVLLHGLLNLQLYKLGAGVFYRYGPYGFDNTGDNFAYKVSIVFPIENMPGQ